VIILASLVVVLMLAVIGLGAWFIFGGGGNDIIIRTEPPTPPAGIGVPPPPPPVPVIPPVDPAAPPASSGGTISKDLVYPGAEETMNVSSGDGAKMLQLRTTDPMSKVVDWYIKKLNPTKQVNIPGISTILKTDEVNAIITRSGEGTQIMLTQGKE
jgi:hypothetical protein